MSKNLSVMHRVKWLLNESALYMLYCTLLLPYISYCTEIWGTTYKSRVQPLYIIQKKAMRICAKIEYRAHSKPSFLRFNALTLFDLVMYKSMITMYKIYNKLMPSNIISRYEIVHTAHNTRQAGNFKNRYCRTTLKSMCLSVKGPSMWNKLPDDVKNCANVFVFKKKYQKMLIDRYRI